MHHQKIIAISRHKKSNPTTALDLAYYALSLITEKDMNKITIDCPKKIPIKYVLSLETAVRALIANAIDANDGKVNIKITESAENKAIIEISNRGEFDWKLLRKHAKEEARNGNMYEIEGNYYIACYLNLNLEHIEDKKPVSEEQVNQMQDQDLPFIRHLTTKKGKKTIGGRGIGLAVTNDILESGNAELEIVSENGMTTARITLD